MEYKSNKTILTVITLAIVLSIGGNIAGIAHAGSPSQNYSVGFTDGHDDCVSGTSTAYNSHSNASHHSDDYNNGYNAGMASCKNVNDQNINNIDQNNRNQNQGQTSGQSVFCVNVFGACPTTSGQSQGLQN